MASVLGTISPCRYFERKIGFVLLPQMNLCPRLCVTGIATTYIVGLSSSTGWHWDNKDNLDNLDIVNRSLIMSHRCLVGLAKESPCLTVRVQDGGNKECEHFASISPSSKTSFSKRHLLENCNKKHPSPESGNKECFLLACFDSLQCNALMEITAL